MTTYRVTAVVTISLYQEIQADSQEEAMEKAENLDMPSICWSCSGKQNDETWALSDGIDGEAQEITITPTSTDT